jgi:hypothetical protein
MVAREVSVVGGTVGAMAFQRKRPCAVCRRWFQPDPRIGARQRVCPERACQVSRRRRQQAEWRKQNPEYFVARRLQARAVEARDPELRLPPPLSRLPWDLAQSQFGAQGADFMAELGRVVVRVRQSQSGVQAPDSS